MVKKTEIDGKVWFAVERFKIVLATILLLCSLFAGAGSYFVNKYRLDQAENAIAFISEDYVSREVLQLRLDKLEVKIDNLGSIMQTYLVEKRRSE